MNRFGDTQNATQYQDVVRDQTQRGTNENERAMRDTRGAPEKYSIEEEFKSDLQNRIDNRFSFDDEDYLLAVRAGDMDAAQEMVDEAAKKTGYMIMLLAGERKGTANDFYKAWNCTRPGI